MKLRRLPIAVVLLAVWALLITSCSGGELTKDEYGSELRATMQELETAYGDVSAELRIEGAGSDTTSDGEQDPAGDSDDAPATVGAIIDQLERTQIALRDAGNRLDGIDAPADVDADHEQLVAGVRDMADDIDLLIEAQELAATDAARAAKLARDFASSEAFDDVRNAAQRINDAGIDAGL